MKLLPVVAGRKSDRVNELEDLVRRCSQEYYNTGKFLKYKGVTYTDKIFDELVDELKELYPKSDVLKMVGAPVKKQKVKLPFYMGSLDKMKPDTAASWLASSKGPYFASDKLDGVSIELIYSTNGKTKAYTRGDGTIGQDISHLVPHLKVPDLKVDLAVRGEIIMSREKFKSWSEDFENARNMMSGLVNRKDVHKGIKDADVVIYEQLEPRGQPSKTLANLKAKGFHIAPGKVYETLTVEILSNLLVQRKKESKYEIDGLVIVLDKNNPLNLDGNPKWGRAFKQTMEEDILETTVINVEWNPSKNGLLKPRVQVKPVRLSGATVNFATGFNAKFINDNKIGPGAVIRLTRSGDVIPHITEIVKPAAKAQQPSSEFKYEWSKNKVDYVLTNATEFDDYVIKRIVAFFKTIGVEYFSEGLVERFMGYGYDTVGKLIKAKASDFLKIEGIQETMAKKIYNNIQQSIINVPLAKLIAATNIYPNMGETRITMVLDVYPDILYTYQTKSPSSLAETIASKVPGFSALTAKNFVDGLPKVEKWLKAHPEVTYDQHKKKKVIKGGSLEGQQVVFTGFRSKEGEEKIIKLGGTVGSGVSSKTTLLVVKDKSSTSDKATKAKSLGIKIMDGQEFMNWINKQG